MQDDFRIDFIGIGGQKCATSWIFKCLSEHPEVCVCSSKETHFFCDDKKFAQGLEFYQQHFDHCSGSQAVGEFSSAYLGSKQAPERIQNVFPDVKLIVSLRQPVDRAFSHYLHLKSKRMIEPDETIAEAIKKYPEVVEYGMYGKCLERYLDTFPAEQILIVWYDDLQKDPINFIKKIYKFLSVDENFVPKIINQKYHTAEVRASKIYRKINKTYIQLRQHALGRLLIKILKITGINSYNINNLIQKNQPPKPEISAEDRGYLQAIFDADIEKLEKLISQDLSNWR
jgi:hypothetical protein